MLLGFGCLFFGEADDAQDDKEDGKGKGSVVHGRVKARCGRQKLADMETLEAEKLGILDEHQRRCADNEAEYEEWHGFILLAGLSF